MARVVLITTGKMEERALAASLGRIFPGHDFHCLPRLDGFTSAPLPPVYEPPLKRFANLNKFANALIGRIAGGRSDEPPADFVIGLDDVELANARAPERITQSLRSALADNLSQWDHSRDEQARLDLRAKLAARCSFHLMAPMTEAYFFGDPAALARATTPGAHHPCCFDATNNNVEEFYVEDSPFSTPPVSQRRDRYDWRTANREWHPKHYLEYLTDETLTGRGRYDELLHGAPALAALDWAHVMRHDLTRTTAFARFARSLLADLRSMLATSPLGISTNDLDTEHCHPLTRLSPSERLLRNL
jgi:hypothetical protein